MRLEVSSNTNDNHGSAVQNNDISTLFRKQFADKAADPAKFDQLFSETYGESFDAQTAESLRQLALDGDFSWLPDVEYLPAGEFNGGLGAYNANTDTVFINDDIRGTKAAQDVYIEEVGHHIDTSVNKIDARGDEGELFSALLQNKPLTSQQLQALRSEDDSGQLNVNGQTLDVEFRAPSGTVTVQPGDTLSKIAAQQGVSLDDLLSANPQITNPNLIFVGQQINVPNVDTPDTAEEPAEPYTVKAGDTLSSIAQEHGVSLNALISANPQISNPDRIEVGQQINLPDDASVAPGDTSGPGETSGPVGDIDVETLLQAVPADIRNAHTGNIREHIERIVNVAQREGLTQEQTAYVLATATHESHLGRYMQELSTGAQYEGRPDLGNTQPGDGVRFKGRGYVQITGRANYQDWSNRLGIDLVGNPELAEDPEIAAEILVRGMRDGTFTGAPLNRYINDSGTDFVNARRVVNGTDRADLIAGYANDFNGALAQSSAPGSEPAGADTSVSVGPERSGADLEVKSSANIDNLDPRITATFDDIVSAWAAANGPTPVITSGNDGRHRDGSFHYQELAIDLRANNISDSLAQSIADDLARRLGADFDVIFERFPNNPANDHIHIEFDPD